MKLVDSGPYQWDDLPPAARALEALDVYAGEVANGGHFQWLQNRRYDEGEVAACKTGMAMLPANPFQAIFAQAVRAIEKDPGLRDRFRARDIKGWTEAEFEAVAEEYRRLDQLFYREAGGSDALIKLISASLLARPEVRLVDNWKAEIDALRGPIGSPAPERNSYNWAVDHFRRLNRFLSVLCLQTGRRRTGPWVFMDEPRLRPGSTCVRFDTDQGPAKTIFKDDAAALLDVDSYDPVVVVEVPEAERIDFDNLRRHEDAIRKTTFKPHIRQHMTN
jgi:hypothetical protein